MTVHGALGLLVALGLSVVLLPSLWARALAVPLGLPRLAWLLGWLATRSWHRDPTGGAALTAARALLRQRRPSAKAAAWIEARLAASRPLGGAGIAASGLLADARGDLAGARALLASVAQIDPLSVPPRAVRLAGEWLSADAAERGDWARVVEIGGAPSATRASRLLGKAARRLLGQSVPSTAGLIAAWLLAGRPRATWPLLRRALASGEPAPSPAREPIDVAPREDPLTTALALHATVLRCPAASVAGDDLRRLAARWDEAACDGALRDGLDRRARDLDLPLDHGALARVVDAAVEELAAVVVEGRVALRPSAGSATLGRITARVRDLLLSTVEQAAAALSRRATSERALPAVEEWREWTALVGEAERASAIGGEEVRRLAFPTVHRAGGDLAVWLWNVRRERRIAHAMFRWMRDEAAVVGDERARELEEKNLRCGWR